MNSDFYFYLPTFSNTFSNRFSISVKYYFFIHYLFFFEQLHIFQHFFYSISDYYNRKKKIWRMNSSPSDLMSYCSWAKKNSRLENLLETIFWVSFSIIENILLLATPLEILQSLQILTNKVISYIIVVLIKSKY